jgi:hypothetical protein
MNAEMEISKNQWRSTGGESFYDNFRRIANTKKLSNFINSNHTESVNLVGQ